MATINDVAKRAGVSRGTVSNVINGVKVRPGTKEKVEAAIKELGYVPNAYARGLKSNKTHTVALILPTVWLPFFSKLTNDIENALREYGYKLLLCHSQNDYQRELEYIEMAKENKVDGILLITYSNIWPYLKDSNIPVVAIERYFSKDIPFISTDNFYGGELAAKKLHELGSKKLLFVARKSDENQVTEYRRQGFICWCNENDLDYDELYIDASSEDFREKLSEKVTELYRDALPYDGIFAAVDRYAEYFLETLNEVNPSVIPGQEIQIIGYDGVPTHYNDIIRISSIKQPVEKIAKEAVDMLIAQIEHRELETYQLIKPEFVEGRTTRKKVG